jgi:hypothetical protein
MVMSTQPTAWPIDQLPPPIDMVYIWCGEDPNSSPGHDRRQRDNHELLYSLRSVWKHARWVRRVYILINSDRAAPSWLRSPSWNAWIHIIDRCSLFTNPADCPTLNSHAAMSVVHRIRGLSNMFLLMDDDIFFARDVTPDFWFDRHSRPIVRTSQAIQPVYPPGTELPADLRLPAAKWNDYHHRVSPVRVDFILDFEARYPGYHEFVQSHSDKRFGSTNTTEEMCACPRLPPLPYFADEVPIVRQADALVSRLAAARAGQ